MPHESRKNLLNASGDRRRVECAVCLEMLNPSPCFCFRRVSHMMMMVLLDKVRYADMRLKDFSSHFSRAIRSIFTTSRKNEICGHFYDFAVCA